MIVAGIALLIDVVTAMLTYAMSKSSMKSVPPSPTMSRTPSDWVIIAGSLILNLRMDLDRPGNHAADSSHILYQAFTEIGGSIRVLMMGAPADTAIDRLVSDLREANGVVDVHHLHVWALEESHNALEAHLVLCGSSLADAAANPRTRQKTPQNWPLHPRDRNRDDRCDTLEKLIGHRVE